MFRILIFFGLFFLAAANSCADCDKYLTAVEKYNEADIVFLGEVVEKNNLEDGMSIYTKVLKVFKGKLEQELIINIDNLDFLPKKSVTDKNYYLIYADLYNSSQDYYLSTCFTFQEWDVAEKEMEELKKTNVCIDSDKVDPTAICTMEYDPVCGCNGETYGNKCQAENSGVKAWAKGECTLY